MQKSVALMRAVGGVALLLALPRPTAAQRVEVDLLGGSAYNVPTSLTIRQDGYPDIRHTAWYDTRPFGPYSPYYAWRVAFWHGQRAWEIQHVHHRLFLRNTTPEIEAFAIHFGYSYVLVGRAWLAHGVVFHAAGGGIVTSPANRIRGKAVNMDAPESIDTGYDLSGVGASLAVSKSADLSRHVAIVGELAFMMATASVPVYGGSARAPNASLHGRLGLKLRF